MQRGLTCSKCGQSLSPDFAEEFCSKCQVVDETKTQGTLPEEIHESVPGQSARGLKHKVLGDYEILGEIARGGMGIVYRARQVSLNRIVALKMMMLTGADDNSLRDRFRIEAEAVAALDHPNIIPIYEVGEFNGLPYYSMKLITGGRLTEVINNHDPKNDLSKLVLYLEKISTALQHSHERGVIHRDVKPSNILIDENGEPIIADFGLAKRKDNDATTTGAIIGTPRYMAPEQAAGLAKAATIKADIYSLGVILYEILAGCPPFTNDDPLAVLVQVARSEAEPPSSKRPNVDKGLEAVCMKCLAKDPKDRYFSAGALASDLGKWLRGETLSVRPPRGFSVLLEWLRKNSSAAIRVIVISFLCGVVMSYSFFSFMATQIITSTAKTYDKYPSLERPAVVRYEWILNNPFSDAIRPTLPFLFILAWFSQGPLLYLFLRPRDLSTASVIGLGGGTIVGATAFMLGISQVFLMAEVVIPEMSIVSHLAVAGLNKGASQEVVRNHIFEKYPDLKTESTESMGTRYYPIYIARQISGIFAGIFYATAFVLVAGVGSNVCQLLAIMYLRSRGNATWERVIEYLELSVHAGIIIMLLLMQSSVITSGIYIFHTNAATLLLLVIFGVVGVMRRIPLNIRLACYISFITFIGISSNNWYYNHETKISENVPNQEFIYLFIGSLMLTAFTVYRQYRLGTWLFKRN